MFHFDGVAFEPHEKVTMCLLLLRETIWPADGTDETLLELYEDCIDKLHASMPEKDQQAMHDWYEKMHQLACEMITDVDRFKPSDN